jgi:DNA-binding NarL/FixJ family response regulator
VNVLIVDDDAGARWAIEHYVKPFATRIETAGSLAEAGALLPLTPVDLAIVEQDLEGIGYRTRGFDVLREIKIWAPAAWVIVISGYWPDEHVIERALKLGAHDYIVKDGTFAILLRAKAAQVKARVEERRL